MSCIPPLTSPRDDGSVDLSTSINFRFSPQGDVDIAARRDGCIEVFLRCIGTHPNNIRHVEHKVMQPSDQIAAPSTITAFMQFRSYHRNDTVCYSCAKLPVPRGISQFRQSRGILLSSLMAWP